jgi:hypothetical protein
LDAAANSDTEKLSRLIICGYRTLKTVFDASIYCSDGDDAIIVAVWPISLESCTQRGTDDGAYRSRGS